MSPPPFGLVTLRYLTFLIPGANGAEILLSEVETHPVHRTTQQRWRTFWRLSQPATNNPFLYANYRGYKRRTLQPSLYKPNLKPVIDLTSLIFSASLRAFVDNMSLLLGYPTLIISSMPRLLVIITVLALLPTATCAGDNDDSTVKLAPFDGVIANFTSWLISFTAWVAWKKPELMDLVNGTLSVAPAAAVPDAPTPTEKKRIREWTLYNTQLYGAIVTHVSSPIQASLHVNSTGDGVKALKYLKDRYGSQSTGDRAEATLRLQRSHIDSRAKISADDVMRQYNEMSLAADDIVAAGGTRPDDILLISMFENSLPSSYSMIRQMIRYSQHATFDSYYNDLLSQVKAEFRANEARSSAGAFVTYGKGDIEVKAKAE